MTNQQRFAPRGFEYDRERDMRMASMKKRKSEDEIDERVVAQAADDSAWTKPMAVERNGATRISLPVGAGARGKPRRNAVKRSSMPGT